ncbi:hypothetical protein R11007_04707 [Ralstonia holmesii]|nr:hypothetical protein R11007_04707 [Ralstonia sp. LMG 32967]
MSDGIFVRQGQSSQLNITTATPVKTVAGRIVRVQVLVAGSAAGAVYDGTGVTGNTVANQVFVIPNTVGSYLVDHPCVNGVVVVPGTGQTVAVTYD